jgi:hypothetical protein
MIAEEPPASRKMAFSPIRSRSAPGKASPVSRQARSRMVYACFEVKCDSRMIRA